MSEVVIGEAVVLDLRPARLPSRALAFAIDVLIIAVLGALVLTAMALLGSDLDDALAAAVMIIVLVGLFVGYPLLWETLTRGRSPGKYALGLRVVRDDGGPVRFRHALTRALTGLLLDFGIASGGTGVMAVVVSLGSTRGKRMGDLLAGTMVLRERVPRAGATELPPVDPGLAAWATGLELSGVPDDLALTARQFLSRAGQLAPHVRTSMAERLATDVWGRVAPPPPPGVAPEAYLAAVLGERRHRETARLAAARPRPATPDAWSVPVPVQASGPPDEAPPGAGAPSAWAPSGAVPAPAAEPDHRSSAAPAGVGGSGTPADPGFAPPG